MPLGQELVHGDKIKPPLVELVHRQEGGLHRGGKNIVEEEDIPVPGVGYQVPGHFLGVIGVPVLGSTDQRMRGLPALARTPASIWP